MGLSVLTQMVLVAVAFFAELISSIAGSGGVLTLPALLWFGLAPLTALATNKVQSSVGTLSSTWNFFRKGHLEIKPLLVSVLMAVLGLIVRTTILKHLIS